MEDDDDALYGDIAAVSERGALADLSEKLAESEKQRVALETALQQQRAEKKELQKANDTLANNISVLFNTARAEIDRKTRDIQRLEQELHRATTKR